MSEISFDGSAFTEIHIKDIDHAACVSSEACSELCDESVTSSNSAGDERMLLEQLCTHLANECERKREELIPPPTQFEASPQYKDHGQINSSRLGGMLRTSLKSECQASLETIMRKYS
jgi:hypothetical protein